MNGQTDKFITLKVEGVDAEHGHVRVEEFLQQIEHLLAALNGVDKIVGETAKPTLYYRIVDARHSSPLEIKLEPVLRKGISNTKPDHIKVRHARFFRELNAIRYNEPISPEIDEPLLEHLRDLAGGIGQTFKNAVIANGTEKVELDKTFETNVCRLIDEEDASYGHVEGRLDAVNIHATARRFWIYPRIGAQRIRCDFLPGTQEEVRKALGHYISVEGVKYFHSQSPYPFRVAVRDFEILDNDAPVYLKDLSGMVPDATGKMSTVDFVRTIRDEWD
jgi:hypothetical protein